MSETQKWVEESRARLSSIKAGHAGRQQELEAIKQNRIRLEERMRKLGVNPTYKTQTT